MHLPSWFWWILIYSLFSMSWVSVLFIFPLPFSCLSVVLFVRTKLWVADFTRRLLHVHPFSFHLFKASEGPMRTPHFVPGSWEVSAWPRSEVNVGGSLPGMLREHPVWKAEVTLSVTPAIWEAGSQGPPHSSWSHRKTEEGVQNTKSPAKSPQEPWRPLPKVWGPDPRLDPFHQGFCSFVPHARAGTPWDNSDTSCHPLRFLEVTSADREEANRNGEWVERGLLTTQFHNEFLTHSGWITV